MLQSVRLAECLQASGVITGGDVIGLCSENRILFPVPMFACFFLGATLAPLNTSYTKRMFQNFALNSIYHKTKNIPDELHHAVNKSKPKVIFASNITVSRIADCAKRNNFIQKIITFDDLELIGLTSSICTTLDEFLRSTSCVSRLRFECKAATDMKANTALVLCSSGTTGLPKGVQLTQSNVHTAVSQLA